MQLNGWDHALKVTSGGKGLVGHAGSILLRKAADQTGLSAVLSAALRKKNASPLFDRGIVLVSVAVSIALGATSMSDIALLAHLGRALAPRALLGQCVPDLLHSAPHRLIRQATACRALVVFKVNHLG